MMERFVLETPMGRIENSSGSDGGELTTWDYSFLSPSRRTSGDRLTFSDFGSSGQPTGRMSLTMSAPLGAVSDIWDREDMITQSVLNALSGSFSFFGTNTRTGELGFIQGQSVQFSAVSAIPDQGRAFTPDFAAPVPLPAALPMALLGLLGLLAIGRVRRS